MNIVHWLPRYVSAQTFLADLPAGARVLDIACGEGDFSKFLGAHGCWVWGADLSEAVIRKGRPANAHPRVAFCVADAGVLPFADAAFDWVVSFDTLDDLPDDTSAAVELTRVLKSGGVLLLCVPARAPTDGNLFWEQRALRRWLPEVLRSRSRSPATGHNWFESTREDTVQFREYSVAMIEKRFPQLQLVRHDFALKRFSALAMDVAYGVRGFPRLGLRPHLYWLGTRLDAMFCRGASHPGYTLLVKLRKK
jgi:ubiquinone/menaquinone biosynthesis C-methylase UbiE